MIQRLSIWLLLLFLLLPATAQAYQMRMGDHTNTLVLSAAETLDEEALLMAYNLEVHSRAERDLWLLASTAVLFDGQVQGDLRVLAGSTVIDGGMQQNLLAYARGLQLTTNAIVEGQAALFGQNVICEGTVNGDAWIVAKSVTLGGEWTGTVRVQADEIRVVPGTHIGGDLVYASSQTLAYDPSVTISGDVKPVSSLVADSDLAAPVSTRSRFAFHGYLFLAALLVGMPFVGLFPLAAGGAVRNLRRTPWRVLLAGTLAVLLGPFLIAFAVMTLIGIPLALLLAALYISLAYLSHIIVALWLGHMLLRTPGPQTFARVLTALAVGLFLLYVAAALPGVASFLVLPVVILGAGALLLALLQRPVIQIPIPPPPPPPSVPKAIEPPETHE